MKKLTYIFVFIILSGFVNVNFTFAQKGPTDPMSVDSWTVNFGIGPGIHYYTTYAAGFGPGLEFSFEKGMWQLGPGVLTLGAEMGFSYFSYSGYYNSYYYLYHYYPGFSYKDTWLNFIMAARCAYHY